MSLYSRAEKVMRPALCSDTAVDLLQEADATIAAKDAEIARLRDALEWLLSTVDRQTWSMSRFHAAKDKARAALAQVAEVGND